MYRYLLSVVLIIGIIIPLNAQKKKEKLSSGAFSKYDKVFRGNLDEINLPDYSDGPHFSWIDSKMVRMWYVDHGHEENSISIREKRFKIKDELVEVKGLKGDKNKYWLRSGEYPVQGDTFKDVEKILAVGDVHGEYDVMVKLLKGLKVVDKDLNWNWGTGHLVFIGDIFDRGDKVTESLYLIKKLQKQAKQQNGRVHLLYGNHEIMVLMNDSRYIAPKYKNMCKRLMMNYPRFFAEDTELGKWLRSLNSAVKINDLMFVHGGLSPDLVERGLTIQMINEDVRASLKAESKMSHAEIMKKIYFPGNPLWYRGYLMKTRNYSIINNEELDLVLNYFKVKKIFFGHTEVESIRLLHGNRVGAINVPMGYDEIKPQVMLVEDKILYRCFMDGTRELIENYGN